MDEKEEMLFDEESINDENSEMIDISYAGKLKSKYRKSFNSKFNNLNVKYKKDKKVYILIALSFLVVISSVIGSSFAYLTYVSKAENTTKINFGKLLVIFDSSSNVINMENALPAKDEEGLKSSYEYTFEVTNKGDTSVNYNLLIENTCKEGEIYKLNNKNIKADKCIPNNYIKVALKQEDGTYKIIKKENIENYILDTSNLKINESKKYTAKIWLDYETPNDYNGKDGLNVLYIGSFKLDYEQIIE